MKLTSVYLEGKVFSDWRRVIEATDATYVIRATFNAAARANDAGAITN